MAHGPQQVNSSATRTSEASCLRENKNLQNELLEAKDGERPDFGAAGMANGANSAMAPLGELNRP
jgi:hypothetical protein